MSVDKGILIELYSILFAEGLWNSLSPITKEFGEKLYLEETGNEMVAPPGAMKFSLEQHIELIDRVLPSHHKATDFWRIVTQISWLSIAIEKNPMLVMEIRDSDDPQALVEALEARSRQ